MTRHAFHILFALVPFCAVFAGDPAPDISYNWNGADSTFTKIAVEIRVSGEVTVAVHRESGNSVDYSTKLTSEELAALGLAVRASGFFDISPDPAAQPAFDHSGHSVLSISYRDQQRTLDFAHLSALKPLETFLWKLVNQADLSEAAEASGRFYELLGAIDSRHAAAKILQPYLFKPKIVASLPKQTEFSTVAWRLQALSCLTTPEEFAGIVAQVFPAPDTKQWRFWLTCLSTHECYGNLQKEHLQALFPLFLEQIKRYGAKQPPRNLPEGEAFNRFRGLFEDYHYDTGLPKA